MPFWTNHCRSDHWPFGITQATGGVTTLPVWIDANTMVPTTQTGQAAASALYYQTQALNNSFNQTAAAYDSGWTVTQPTANATVFTHTIYWIGGDQYVDQQTYMMLAQGRVVLAQERLDELARRQEEQRLEQERVRLQHEETCRQQRERYQLALSRSRELLVSHLTVEQRETFSRNNWFIVQGGKTGTRYRVRTNSYAGNIEVLKGDKSYRVDHVLCGHLNSSLPLHDHHIAQKMSLECEEEYFLSIANRRAA
jgi:hypothetical protein